jgi:hypothetical protein
MLPQLSPEVFGVQPEMEAYPLIRVLSQHEVDEAKAAQRHLCQCGKPPYEMWGGQPKGEYCECEFPPINYMKVDMLPASDAVEMTIPELISNFSVEEATFDRIPFSINRGGSFIAKTTRRGFANRVLVHPDSVKDLHPYTIRDERYQIIECEHVPVNEFVSVYIGNNIDRGWFVLQNGRILLCPDRDHGVSWKNYGARARLVSEMTEESPRHLV